MFYIIGLLARGWWNWQTRTFEGRMLSGMWVQVPPRAPIMQKTQKIQPVVKIIPHYLIILLIAAVGAAVYYRSIIKGIFFFDDEGLILNNYMIKSFSYIKEIRSGGVGES